MAQCEGKIYVQRASSTGFSGDTLSLAYIMHFPTRPLADMRLHRLDDTAPADPEIVHDLIIELAKAKCPKEVARDPIYLVSSRSQLFAC